jgi:hypothetical protein
VGAALYLTETITPDELAEFDNDYNKHRRLVRARRHARDRASQHRARLRPRVVRFAHPRQFKRLLVCCERRAEVHEAMLAIGCCLVCFRRLSTTHFAMSSWIG